MRSLVIRFMDCEGPGIIHDILQENGYTVTYHDAYKKGLKLIPDSHQIFDIIILMGGPQTVYAPEEYSFFAPYFELVENSLSLNYKKLIGVCLGSQIIAKVLDAKVHKGENGAEVGFSKVKVLNPNHDCFNGVDSNEIMAFHLHEDTFSLPKNSEKLLSSSQYDNQMFVYENRIFGIQCHLEVTLSMLQVWKNAHKKYIEPLGYSLDFMRENQKLMERDARKIFKNIIQIK